MLHVLKYLGADTSAPAAAVEAELEQFLDRIQPGWRDLTVERRFLPRMTVAHSLPSASENGLAGRPTATLRERPHVFLASDWVGPDGLLADASAASAVSASALVLGELERARPSAQREPLHVGA